MSYLPTISALTAGPRETRSVSERLLVFAPLSASLPGTFSEARAIAEVRPGTEVRLGSASSEAGVRTALLAGASVHIASHGSHNSQNPLFSRMTVGKSRPRSIGG